jgi:nucleotide-binding universal stress UspA family protein
MYQEVLVAIDGSECANCALREALAIVKLTNGKLHIVYVVDEPAVLAAAGYYDPTALREAMIAQANSVLDAARGAAEKEGVRADSEVLYTIELGRDIADCINAAAARRDADLTVLGTHGRRGAGRLVLGSVAERVLRASHTPVLMVRAIDSDS